MRLPPIVLLAAVLIPGAAVAQQSNAGTPVPARREARESPRMGRKTLPDPSLFDGSQNPAEKQPEFGMLGEFELPGSEEQSDRVGGDGSDNSQGLPLPPLPIPGLPGLQSADGAAGGMGLPGLTPPAGAGGAAGSPSLQLPTMEAGATPGASGAQGSAGAPPGGIQAQQLKGGTAMQGEAAGAGGKPREIAYGDASLQIQPMGSTANAVLHYAKCDVLAVRV